MTAQPQSHQCHSVRARLKATRIKVGTLGTSTETWQWQAKIKPKAGQSGVRLNAKVPSLDRSSYSGAGVTFAHEVRCTGGLVHGMIHDLSVLVCFNK
jgi:hypothetical protein